MLLDKEEPRTRLIGRWVNEAEPVRSQTTASAAISSSASPAISSSAVPTARNAVTTAINAVTTAGAENAIGVRVVVIGA